MMAKNCPNCGAEVEDGALFCGSCGTPIPQEQAPVEPTPTGAVENPYQAPAYGAQQPAGYGAQPAYGAQQPAGYDQQTGYSAPGGVAAPPKPPRKPLSKTTKIIIIAVAAVVVLALAAYFILNAVFTPAKTINGFVDALENANVADVQKYAASADPETPLDETAAQALIDLYVANPDFRESVSSTLEAQKKSKKNMDLTNVLFQLKAKKHVFFSTYEILISPCRVEISADRAGTTVTIGEQTLQIGRKETSLPDSIEEYGTIYLDDDYASDSGRLSAVLPGRYKATATYENALGQSFTKEFDLDITSVSNYSYVPSFDAASMWISNYSDTAVDLYMGDTLLCTMSTYSDLYFNMLESGTTFSAKCAGSISDTGNASYAQTATWGDVTVSATAGTDNDFSISFPSIYVYNDYDFDLKVSVDGAEVGTIYADGSWEMAPMAVGMELSFEPAGDLDLPPYIYTVDEDSYSVSPSFDVLSMYIDNYYHTELSVSVNGEERGTVPSYGSLSLSVVVGDEISVALPDAPFAAPYVHAVEDKDDDYMDPQFELSSDAAASLNTFLTDYVTNAFNAHNALDTATLAALEQSDLTEDLIELAQEDLDEEAELGYRATFFTLTATSVQFSSAEIEVDSTDGVYVDLVADVFFDTDYVSHDEEGNETYHDSSSDEHYTLYLDLVYSGDAWHIAE